MPRYYNAEALEQKLKAAQIHAKQQFTPESFQNVTFSLIFVDAYLFASPIKLSLASKLVLLHSTSKKNEQRKWLRYNCSKYVGKLLAQLWKASKFFGA